MFKRLIGVLVIAAVSAIPNSIYPDERLFTYSYEPKTLPKGAFEYEQWLTLKTGKEDTFEQWKMRSEFEYGITDKLTTALYFNLEYEVEEEDDEIERKFEFEGISNEWKYKLSDPTVDAIGSLLYFEWGYGSTEFELEQKIVLGKNFGKWVVAYNMIFEEEWKFRNGEKGTQEEFAWENTLGIAYRINPNWSLGIEARQQSVYEHSEHLGTGFFVGPVVHYATEKWWATLTILPQIAGRPATSGSLDLDEHTRAEVRLIFGIDF